MKINYVNGDATTPIGEGKKIIVHCCNDLGGWGAGFVLAISKKWKEPENSYRIWADTKNDPDSTFKLGNYKIVKTDDEDIFVCNLIGQRGIGFSFGNPPIRYDAIKEGFQHLAEKLSGKSNVSIHMPRIGCGLAGGNWKNIEQIIKETFIANNINVTVYDFV